MDERLSIPKKKEHDSSITAFRIVQEATSDENDTPVIEEPPAGDQGKNPNAVALGRLGGKKGGKARAAKLSAEQRRDIAKKAAAARWGKDAPEIEDGN